MSSEEKTNKETILFIYLMQFAGLPTRGLMTLMHISMNLWHWKKTKKSKWQFSHFKWQLQSSIIAILTSIPLIITISTLFKYRVILKYRQDYLFDTWIFILSLAVVALTIWYSARTISGILAYARELEIKSLFSKTPLLHNSEIEEDKNEELLKNQKIKSVNFAITNGLFLSLLFWISGGISLLFGVISMLRTIRKISFEEGEIDDLKKRHFEFMKKLGFFILIFAMPWFLISMALLITVHNLNPISNYESLIPFFFAAVKKLADYFLINDFWILAISSLSYLITLSLIIYGYYKQIKS